MVYVYYSKDKDLSRAGKAVFDELVRAEGLKLNRKLPLKVHFGEKGNSTYIKPGAYEGIIGSLKGREPFYIETNVLYRGERTNKKAHIALAKRHGFNLPIVIADGNTGESFSEIKIDKKHFKTCKIGKEFSDFSQLVVLSHFKGHRLSGFGGAIKQLAMGFASRGGKLAQHLDTKPRISWFKCRACGVCKKHCPVAAIKVNKKAKIDYEKCVGCAVCSSVCPYNAVKLFSFSSLSGIFGTPFYEKLAEYAYAAQLNKSNIYINYAVNITRGCDCEGRKMKAFAPDIGVLASTDPVALDNACLQLLKIKGYKLKGEHVLKYAENIGLGSRKYKLIQV
ncbi:MAG: DUF362 domain-containing protein [Nanoarchaeota archaeon]